MHILSLQGLTAIRLRQLALLTFFGIGRLTFTGFSSLLLVDMARNQENAQSMLYHFRKTRRSWGWARGASGGRASRARGGRAVEGDSGKFAMIQDGASSSLHSLPAVHWDWREILFLFQNRSGRCARSGTGKTRSLGFAGRITVITYRRNVAMLDGAGKDVLGMTEHRSASACAAAAHITFFKPDMLMAPKLPTPAETQGVLLEVKKRMLSFLPCLRALTTASRQLCAEAEDIPDRRELFEFPSNAEAEKPKDAASSKSKPKPKPKKKLPWRRTQ
ncbi:hypothetical protein K438DRAFT_1781722 [Mycena galopus ATCC 62051]|nr:hypothetical protein K438DRAFT_1781722 [Mycena galopus ATCC 62051]